MQTELFQLMHHAAMFAASIVVIAALLLVWRYVRRAQKDEGGRMKDETRHQQHSSFRLPPSSFAIAQTCDEKRRAARAYQRERFQAQMQKCFVQ